VGTQDTTAKQRQRSTVSLSAPPPQPLRWESCPAPAARECSAWTLDQPHQLAAARRGARDHLTRDPVRASPETAEQVVMVLDELATNALRHGAPPATVHLCRHAEGWLVVATDAAPDRVPAPAVDRPAEHGGMGLHMVAELAIRHGTDSVAGRKCVWALVAN
jgi:anti-sigma regulatory factor (Ser/Thr protein kinase)